MDTSVILLIVTKLLKLFDMTKPPLGKVEAVLYVLQHVITRGHARILTHPHFVVCLWPRRGRGIVDRSGKLSYMIALVLRVVPSV